jgi:hypothetical protein
MKSNTLLIIALLGLSMVTIKTINQDKEIKELQVRLDEQELLNKIGKELITSRLNIR